LIGLSDGTCALVMETARNTAKKERITFLLISVIN